MSRRRAAPKGAPLHPIVMASESDDALTRSGLRAAAEGIPDDYPDAVLLRTIREATIKGRRASLTVQRWVWPVPVPHGKLASILQVAGTSGTLNGTAPRGPLMGPRRDVAVGVLSVVAGVGFEPTTFRL